MSVIKMIPFPVREAIRKTMFGSTPNTDIVKGLKKSKKDNLTMIDVGAETGYESIVAAKNGFKVYAFEPDERMFGKLKHNIEQENISDIELIKKGVAAKNGTATFFYGKNEGGRSSLIADDPLDQQISIELVRLDTFCKQKNLKPDYLKIDAEGVSFEVLKSFDFSDHSPAFILIEPDDENEEEIKSYLKDKGYHVFHSVFKAKELGARTILKKYAYSYSKDIEFADIVAVHKNSTSLWKHKIN